jgi:hypothetical protein
MKKIMLATLLLITSHIAFSQNDVKIEDKKNNIRYADTTEACNKGEIFMTAEQAPAYQGGYEKLVKDINEKLTLNKAIEGVVYIKFTVNCKGKVYGFNIMQSIDKKTDQIVLNIVRELQFWNSATQDGKAVDCAYGIPVHIKKGKAILLKRK